MTKLGFWALLLALLLSACASADIPTSPPAAVTAMPTFTPITNPTPLPTRGIISPGQLLPYLVQTGDTVTALAAHFNTTADEILAANPDLVATQTLTSGLLLAVPAYHFPLGGPVFKIIPDSEFVYGPANKDFDIAAYVASRPGYLRTLSTFAGGRQRDAAGVVRYVAEQYSINPKLLLALLEWRTGALSREKVPDEVRAAPLGTVEGVTGLYTQLYWAAERLSIGYYGWRSGTLTEIPLRDTYIVRVDMYQNAGTVGVQYLLGQLLPLEEFELAAGPDGFAAVYYALWGNPFGGGEPPAVIPGGLTQPVLELPFASNQVWTFTGGPHPAWGSHLPWAALDFGPPGVSGCAPTGKYVTAAAAGMIARSGEAAVVLDLDGDGYEQTGWVLFYFHIAEDERVAAGRAVRAGDLLGHPSCEGGEATGTHLHLARKYNGEWIPAAGIVPGVLPFVLGGWTAEADTAPYLGRLTRLGAWVEACVCSISANRIYWASP